MTRPRRPSIEPQDWNANANDTIARMNDRVAEFERDYQERLNAQPRGTSGAAAGLREEVEEDVKKVRAAVDDLRATNADTWWRRHEEAVKQTADDIEADVRRPAGARMNKLDEDLDRLAKANAGDWWELTQARVNDYIDRVEKSVARVDDDKPANTTAR